MFALVGVLWPSSDLGSLRSVVGVGWVVEGLAFAVIAQPTDNSGAVPSLDGLGVDAETGGHIGGGERAGGA